MSRRIKRRLAVVERELADLKTALSNMRISTDAIPSIQVSVPGGTVPIKPGPREGRLELSSGNSILTFFP